MIDHLTVSVADLDASTAFYTRVLAPLGYRPLMTFEQFVGFGDVKPYFWLKHAIPGTTPQHIAFAAKSRHDVDTFYREALAAGAKGNGAPGPRTEYHPNYYGGFVIDPLNGHPLEAVCHAGPAAKSKPKAKRAKRSAARRPGSRTAKPKRSNR